MGKTAAAVRLHTELLEVRRSQVHGMGAFAIGPISKGMRLIEYVGERVTHKEADRRYEDKDANDNHTFLFIVDSRTVIDAGVDGNDARFFNHSCDPNCESVIADGRVYIEALRDVQPGAELTYDYQIQREAEDPPDIDDIFACRCGAAQCRGTMLWPTKRRANGPVRKAKRKKAARGKGAARNNKRAKKKGGGRR
jgi:SET domain-containing protein